MPKLERRRPRWLPGLAVLLALGLAGCGSPARDDGQHQEHAAQPAHDMEAMGIQPIEATGSRAPRLTLTATPDSMGGFNLRVKLANFRLAPEHTGDRPVAGEGHLHLYVDGTKRARLYGSWFHLDGLTPGAHTLRVEAVANNHAPYHRDGEPVSAIAAVEAG